MSQLPESLKNEAILALMTAFENAAQTNEHGVAFWTARALQQLLGYAKWDNFERVIDHAIEACEHASQPVENHFQEVFPGVGKNPEGGRPAKDYRLTRYACYLIAQNGDARKKPVAFAQTYFAVQTRRQELRDQEETGNAVLSEDRKRLMLRNEITEHNKKLASAAKGAGVVEPIDFAVFQNFGYKGLYGGLDRSGIQRAKKLKPKQDILNHMGSTELAANLFRATQTEDKLRREQIKGKQTANQTHYEVGKKVRQTIHEIGGTMPECLPAAEDITRTLRRVKKSLKAE